MVVLMGSGAETAHETVDWLDGAGRKARGNPDAYGSTVPSRLEAFVGALPSKRPARLAVLDRTKEPGAPGDPLYLDVMTALSHEARGAWDSPAGRAGRCRGSLPVATASRPRSSTRPASRRSSIELDRGHDRGNHFTVGIVDDVSHTSLPIFPTTSTSSRPRTGSGRSSSVSASDGTVSANKNSIKIIGEDDRATRPRDYFVYDSKKAGGGHPSRTCASGTRPIRSTYLIQKARASSPATSSTSSIAASTCWRLAAPGAVFPAQLAVRRRRVWDHLPREVQARSSKRSSAVFVIDAYAVARDAGMGGRINTIMQTCFFAISGCAAARTRLSRRSRNAIEKTYGKKGTRSWCEQELSRRSTRPSSTCTRSRCPRRRSPPRAVAPPIVAETRRPRLRPRRSPR